LERSDDLQDVMDQTPAAGVRPLPRASDLSGSGLSNALPIGVLAHGTGALLGGAQTQPATSLSPTPAAGAPSVSAAGSSQAVPLVSTPAGRAHVVAAYEVRDQELPSSSVHRPDWNRPLRCALRSADTDARSGVASGRLTVGSALMLPHLVASERLSTSTRERVRSEQQRSATRSIKPEVLPVRLPRVVRSVVAPALVQPQLLRHE
jgi:hypothetical protein